jgi:hypothetical protein
MGIIISPIFNTLISFELKKVIRNVNKNKSFFLDWHEAVARVELLKFCILTISERFRKMSQNIAKIYCHEKLQKLSRNFLSHSCRC